MYVWMPETREIKARLEAANKEELPKLLQDEKLRIQQIKKETLDAYEKAQKLLEELEK